MDISPPAFFFDFLKLMVQKSEFKKITFSSGGTNSEIVQMCSDVFERKKFRIVSVFPFLSDGHEL